MTFKTRIMLLALVALLLAVGIVGMSIAVLPNPPISPTATFPEGIDYPNGRMVPRR
ncbi:MAG: hypothetical protein H6673_02300 [Anaerolineales bacterium]|nr:hypothetical protein [Anaerolineales bacterium]